MNGNFQTIIVLFNFLLKVHSRLSPTVIKETTDEIITVNSGNMEWLRSSIANPIYGYLFDSTGVLNNIRFFGPKMKPNKINGIRNYANDKSNDPVTRLVLELFPSPTGYLCHVRNMESNFGLKFQKNIDDGIQFMANMFINVLKDNTSFQTIKKFKSISDILKSSGKTAFESEDAKIIKLMMIHSFMIHALDTKDHLKKYLNIIINDDDIQNELTTLVLTNVDVVEKVLSFEEINKAFPYSDKNQPPSNSTIPIYDRVTDSFSTKEYFSDCADITLLNLCNCLLYDPKNFCYSLEGLKVDSDIYNFYRQHNQLFTITDKIRNDWSRVVQGLPDFENEDNSKFKLHKIVYLKGKRNEIKAGMINMVNLLIKIFNLEHGKIWKGFKGKDDIGSKFETIISDISKDNNRINIQWTNSFEEIQIDSRTEIFGSLYISFIYGETEMRLKVNQSRSHADIKVIEYKSKKSNDIQPILNSEDNILLSILFKNFIKGNEKVKIDEIFKEIYFSNPLVSNFQKSEVLTDILDLIAKTETISNSNDTIQILKGVVNSILESVNLADIGTREYFKQCLVYSADLTENEINCYWNYSMSRENEVYKLWQNRVLESNVDKIVLDLFFRGKDRLPEVFDVLEQKKHLKSLSFKNIPGKFFTKYYFHKLPRKLTNFETSTTDANYLNPCNIDALIYYLKNLKNLQSLRIKLKCLNNDYERLLSNLESLENLKHLTIDETFYNPYSTISIPLVISSNLHSLEINGSNKFLIEFKLDESKTYNLEKLIISHLNFDNDDQRSENLVSGFKKLVNLKVLKISNINIPLVKLKYFFNILESLSNLEELDLSDCDDFNNEDFISFMKEIKKLKKPTKLKISNISLKPEETTEMLKTISEPTSLRSFKLKLSVSSLYKLYSDAFFLKEFTEALGNLKFLAELEMPMLDLDDKALNIFIESIGKLVNLEKLDISQYQYTEDNTEYLFENLKNLKKLKYLNIKNWKCSSEDLEKLKRELPNLETIIY